MAKVKYYYDTKTLSYKRIELSSSKKLKRLLYFITSSGFIGLIMVIVFFQFFDSPKEKRLNNEIEFLNTQYNVLHDKMNQVDMNFWMVFAFYLYQLSLRLGFMPNLKTCCQCKSVFNHAFINDRTGELICPDCGPQSKLSLNKNSLIFLQKLENLHLDDIQPGMNNTVEMYNALRFLEIFTCIHLEGMDKVRSLNMIHKLLKQ